MKKFYLYMLSALLLSAGAMTFTSCDEDVLDSIDLAGEWSGDMGTSIYMDGYNYRSVGTYIAFHRTTSTGGYGEEIDYSTAAVHYITRTIISVGGYAMVHYIWNSRETLIWI